MGVGGSFRYKVFAPLWFLSEVAVSSWVTAPPQGASTCLSPGNCPLSHPFRPVDGSSFAVLIPSYRVPPVSP